MVFPSNRICFLQSSYVDTMRTARIRLDHWVPAYYHCMGRVAGEPGYLPFDDVEKEKLFSLLERLTVSVSQRLRVITLSPAAW